MIKLKEMILENVSVTDTPEFKRWFGNSKIVDKHGNPKIMYHGKRGDDFECVKKFDQNKFQQNEPHQGGEGFYFTNTSGGACSYTYDKDYNTHDKRVGAYYIKIENPAPNSMVESWKDRIYDKICELDTEQSKIKGILISHKEKGQILRILSTKMREWIQSKGHDGYVSVGQIPDNMGEIVVFDPCNIKSAIDNNGDFNPNDSDTTCENYL